MADPVITDAQASVLALHAQLVQDGFSTSEIERERLLKDASRAEDPQAFINETVAKFAAEIAEHQKPEIDPLNEILYELRRISKLSTDLDKTRKRLTAQAIPLLEERGSLMIVDPTDGAQKIANVIQAQTLQVDAGELLDALNEHYSDDPELALVIWESTLKPPAIDTKDGGLFHQATEPKLDGDVVVEPAKIPPEVIVKVAKYKASAAYVGFAKPGG